jgi:fucose permease
MLEVAGNSFVTKNAPDDIKNIFNVTVSNDNNPLTAIVTAPGASGSGLTSPDTIHPA